MDQTKREQFDLLFHAVAEIVAEYKWQIWLANDHAKHGRIEESKRCQHAAYIVTNCLGAVMCAARSENLNAGNLPELPDAAKIEAYVKASEALRVQYGLATPKEGYDNLSGDK